MSQRQVSAMARFDRYLSAIVSRESLRLLLAAFVRIFIVLAVITAIAVICAQVFGYTELLLNVTRMALVLSPIALLVRYFWQPLHRLRSDKGAGLLASAHPDFGDRLQTYLELRHSDADSAFTPLLAEDNLTVASSFPLKKAIPGLRMLAPVTLLLTLGGGLFAYFSSDSDLRQNDVKHLWAGWIKEGYVEPREILVFPGNKTVLWGSDVDIKATLAGFNSDTVTLSIDSGDEAPASTVLYREPVVAKDQATVSSDIPAPESGDRFGFSLFRVTAPVNYAVSTPFTTSETYRIDVIKPARVLAINAQLNFPDWAQLSPTVLNNIDRLRVVSGTMATFEINTDSPLNAGELILGDQAIPLTLKSANTYVASVSIDRDTNLSVQDHLVGEDITLVDCIPIRLLADRPPEIQFVSPGRDISATPIEEVDVVLEATDDFAIESLSLFYSVNAGEWQEVILPVDQRSHTHTFMLERLGVAESDGTNEGEASSAIPVAPLAPGDLIAYYASVTDRAHSLETDMMLIDIRPFEKRYSQSQGASGGGEGQADDSGEISRRQREILVATWNLLRAQESAVDDGELNDNAGLLSELQMTLFDQANKLAERTEARSLTSRGDDIRQFVSLLRLAAAGMQTSSELLVQLDFESAIQPQQKTLQYLQQAEAIFSDFSVNNQPSDGEGGGAGQDIAEMFELEMDLSRNQYEEPESASERQ